MPVLLTIVIIDSFTHAQILRSRLLENSTFAPLLRLLSIECPDLLTTDVKSRENQSRVRLGSDNVVGNGSQRCAK